MSCSRFSSALPLSQGGLSLEVDLLWVLLCFPWFHDLPGLLWWEQVSWGMLWSLLLRISAAYVKPAGFYLEQTST